MHQLPAKVWNRIAEEQGLRTEWAERMFSLDEAGLEEALERERERLEADKVPTPAISAFLETAPLLWERDAIQAFVRRNPHLQESLPEIQTPAEAARVAAIDRRLDEDASLALVMLLQP